MAAYTPSLRLTLPVTGTDDGTWGDTVNNGITSLTDASIAGTATIIQGNVANYTLTNNSGAADEARNMFLNITGALTAARNVICPTASKLYFIKNSTTGGFAVTLKTSAGTGISVPAGSITALYCDGTNVVDAITYANIPVINATTVDTTNLEVTNIKAKDGTASITLADTTGIATFSKATVISTSDATNAALRVTQTGAGNAFVVEDAANPDASPFVIDPAGVVLAGFTTAPAGGYKAYISGTAFATSSWRVGDNTDGSTSGYIGNISNTTKSLAIHADPDNVGASSVITVNIDGSEKARVDSSGRLFIGTSTASAAGVKNYWNPTGATTAYGALIGGTVQSDVTTAANLVTTIANTAAATFNITNLRHFYATANTFGADSTVTNQYGFYANSDLSAATNNYGFYSAIASATGAFNFYANGTATNYFAGNVGIGTTAPLTALNVNGTGGELIRISVTSDAGTIQEPALGFATGVTNVYPATKISALEFDASDSRASMLFYTRGTNSDVAPTEQMRLDSAGNLGLGVTPSAWNSLYKAAQFGAGASISGRTDSGSWTEIQSNSYRATDGAWKYLTTAAASRQLQESGAHTWYNAPSGTAGNAISFTQAMTLDTSGNLFVGSTSGGAIVNSRINPRVSTTASTATLTPDLQAYDQYNLTAQAAALAVAAPIGTPVDGNKIMIRILDNGTARAITWDATYTVIGVTLPTTTVINKTTYVGCVYNANNTRWDVIAVTTQA